MGEAIKIFKKFN